jgi:SAM-dependent methyltransferase
MTGYGRFARFYDEVMGKRPQARTFIQNLINENAPEARSVLDLACGTGTLMERLSPKYEVYGLDASRAMLAVARKKVPKGRFFRQDMASFRLPHKFDIILCIFDSLNHLLTFAAWERTFRRVRSHLSPRGLFLFDINTVSRLRRLKAETPWIAEFGRNYLILRVDGERAGVWNWTVNVLEHTSGDRYRLVKTMIAERSFSMSQIKRALRESFSFVRTYNGEGGRGTEKSDRVYFACNP